MSEQTLREKLEQLHAELEKADCVDARDCDMLRDVMGHIQVVLEHSAPVPPQRYISLGARLNQALQQFEASHPELVLTIGRVLDHFAQV